jgi:enoyl-CoA hydratase/carnithine racemase
MARVLFEILPKNIGKITLNDPDNLNAMGEDMAAEFRALVAQLQGESRKLRAIILTGAGRAFSAGGNLDMLEAKSRLSGEENRLKMLEFYHSFLGILKLGVPLIAAINGHAVGAGLCLASACDIRVGSDKAKLGFTFTRLGLHPGMGATYFLPRVIGRAAATELLLTGRLIDAEQARAIGLVSSVVSPDATIGEAERIAGEIGACGPESVRQVLETVRGGFAELEQHLEREALAQSVNYNSPEFKEGVRAAIEKRPAQF